MRELINEALAMAVKLNYELSEQQTDGMFTRRRSLDTESIKAKAEGLIKTCNELIVLCEVKR